MHCEKRVQEEVKGCFLPLLILSSSLLCQPWRTSVLGAFCTVFVCSSESMSRFSGIYKIVLVFLSLYEFGKERSAVVGKISSPPAQTRKRERQQNIVRAIFSFQQQQQNDLGSVCPVPVQGRNSPKCLAPARVMEKRFKKIYICSENIEVDDLFISFTWYWLLFGVPCLSEILWLMFRTDI